MTFMTVPCKLHIVPLSVISMIMHEGIYKLLNASSCNLSSLMSLLPSLSPYIILSTIVQNSLNLCSYKKLRFTSIQNNMQGYGLRVQKVFLKRTLAIFPPVSSASKFFVNVVPISYDVVFWDMTSRGSSKKKRRFGRTHLHRYLLLWRWRRCFSETMGFLIRATRRHIPEDILHCYRREKCPMRQRYSILHNCDLVLKYLNNVTFLKEYFYNFGVGERANVFRQGFCLPHAEAYTPDITSIS
jgi:hypothetical protein